MTSVASQNTAKVAKPVPTMSAGGVTEIVVSMSGYRQEVRDYVKQFVNVLHQHAPDIRVAVISNGEYNDDRKRFIKWIDFGAKHDELMDFIVTVERTFGGGGMESANIMRNVVHEKLSLTPGSRRTIMHMGDYPLNYDVTESAMRVVKEHQLMMEQKLVTIDIESGQKQGNDRNVRIQKLKRTKATLKRLRAKATLMTHELKLTQRITNRITRRYLRTAVNRQAHETIKG